MAAFLGPLIGLATGIGGSLLGSKSGGPNPITGLSPGVPGASSSILGNIPGQIQRGNAQIGDASASLSNAGNFFKTILGGSEESTQKLLAPQVNTVLKQYDNAAKVAASIGPRGGGTASSLAEGQVKKAGAYGDILSSVLPGAAEGLAGVGKAQGTLGTTQTEQAVSTLPSILGSQEKAAAQNASAMGGLGSGLGKWLAGLITSGGKSGASSGSSSPNYDTTGAGGG